MSDRYQLGPLLERARKGERDALDALLERLRPYLRLLLRQRLGRHLPARLDASDLVQEALWRVYNGFRDFSGEGVPQFLAWVARIARNVAVSHERHHGADKRDAAREIPGAELLARLRDEAPERKA